MPPSEGQNVYDHLPYYLHCVVGIGILLAGAVVSLDLERTRRNFKGKANVMIVLAFLGCVVTETRRVPIGEGDRGGERWLE